MQEIDPFVPWIDLPPEEPRPGPLSGLRLAVKDIFDVAGLPTGAGNPRWLETHPPAVRDAAAVAALRTAGAALVGKTHTDEMAYSLGGTNAHYGAPVNPAAPGHTCGGSSSGSASAIAGDRADLGLGTDTAGSVRVPASHTGLYGLRPTHARVSRTGVVPLAPSFDVPGLFARDLRTLKAGVEHLVTGTPAPEAASRLLLPADIWAAVPPATAAGLAPALDELTAALEPDRTPLFASPGEWDRAHTGFYTVQAAEAWAAQGEWIERERPEFGPGVGDRFRRAAQVGPDAAAAARTALDAAAALIRRRVAAGAVLAVPSAPFGPPSLDDPRFDRSTFTRFTFIAPAAGLPGLGVPAARVNGLPLGLSLLAAPGGDEALLDLAETLGPAVTRSVRR